MEKLDKIVSSLQMLFEKRKTMDKQIADAEKKLVEAAKLASKAAGQVKAIADKKPALKAAAKKLLKK
jgi:peptidoglycan hydrolase CwlO-like protein